MARVHSHKTSPASSRARSQPLLPPLLLCIVLWISSATLGHTARSVSGAAELYCEDLTQELLKDEYIVRDGNKHLNLTCTFASKGGDASAAAYGERRRASAGGGRGAFTMLLGLPEERAQAPLRSTWSLYFRNLTHTYLQWHPSSSSLSSSSAAAQVPLPQSELVKMYHTHVSQSGEDATTRDDGIEQDNVDDDVHSRDSPRSLSHRKGKNYLLTRVRILADEVGVWSRWHVQRLLLALKTYPWGDPAAVERLFFTRTLRLRFVVDRVTRTYQRSDDGGDGAYSPEQETDREGLQGDHSGSNAAIDSDEEEGEDTTGYLEDETFSRRDRTKRGALGRAPAAAMLSEAASGMLRMVAYPPTPLLVLDQTQEGREGEEEERSTGKAPVVNTRFVCDIHTIKAARAHVREGEAFMSKSQRRSSFRKRQKLRGMGNMRSNGDEYCEGGDVCDNDDDDDEDSDLFLRLPSGAFQSGKGMKSKGNTNGGGAAAPHQWLLTTLLSLIRSYVTGNVEGQPPLSPSQQAARLYASRVSDELGFLSTRSGALLPQWVSQLLGRRSLDTQFFLLKEDDEEEIASGDCGISGKQGKVKGACVAVTTTYSFVSEAHLPATESMCVTILPVRSGANDGLGHAVWDAIPIEVEQYLSLDVLWVKLLLLLWLVRLIKPHMEDSRLLHLVFAALCGFVVLAMLLIFYVIKQVQKMTVGKAGMLMVLAAGGVAALTEGIFSSLNYLFYSIQNSYGFDGSSGSMSELTLYIIAGTLLIGILSSFLVRLFVSEQSLAFATRWSLQGIVLVITVLTFLRNREATMLILIAYKCLHPRLLLQALVWFSRGSHLENKNNDPVERLPASARQEVAYVRPRVVEGGAYSCGGGARGAGSRSAVHSGSEGLSYDAKMQHYADEGADYTRRALEELAAQVRANPSKYAHRLKDPQGVSRWAEEYEVSEDSGYDTMSD